MFHGTNYKRKGESDSSLVSFLLKDQLQFGRIIEFFEISSHIFAKINVFKLCKFDLPTTEESFINTTLKSGLINRFFFKVEETTVFIYISSDCLLHKCVKINQYITEIKYEFEHD